MNRTSKRFKKQEQNSAPPPPVAEEQVYANEETHENPEVQGSEEEEQNQDIVPLEDEELATAIPRMFELENEQTRLQRQVTAIRKEKTWIEKRLTRYMQTKLQKEDSLRIDEFKRIIRQFTSETHPPVLSDKKKKEAVGACIMAFRNEHQDAITQKAAEQLYERLCALRLTVIVDTIKITKMRKE